ncbi:MAG: antibiotic biosynthesis monooxygenase [Chrysiogenia bacterium]
MADKANAFFQYVRKTGEKAYRESPGNRGVRILRRHVDDKAEFLLISLWDSFESIKRFAGEDFNKALYPFPEDREFLVELEPEVKHFEVLNEPAAGKNPVETNVMKKEKT